MDGPQTQDVLPDYSLYAEATTVNNCNVPSTNISKTLKYILKIKTQVC